MTYISSERHDWYVESVRLMWDSMKIFCKSGLGDVDFVVMLLRTGNQSKGNVDKVAQLLMSKECK